MPSRLQDVLARLPERRHARGRREPVQVQVQARVPYTYRLHWVPHTAHTLTTPHTAHMLTRIPGLGLRPQLAGMPVAGTSAPTACSMCSGTGRGSGRAAWRTSRSRGRFRSSSGPAPQSNGSRPPALTCLPVPSHVRVYPRDCLGGPLYYRTRSTAQMLRGGRTFACGRAARSINAQCTCAPPLRGPYRQTLRQSTFRLLRFHACVRVHLWRHGQRVRNQQRRSPHSRAASLGADAPAGLPRTAEHLPYAPQVRRLRRHSQHDCGRERQTAAAAREHHRLVCPRHACRRVAAQPVLLRHSVLSRYP